MKTVGILSVLLVVAPWVTTLAFVPNLPSSRTTAFSKTRVNIFGEDPNPPEKLTRENEPDDYFATNMDKMSDEEKLPVAIAGLVFISLPFIAGLIALYASK